MCCRGAAGWLARSYHVRWKVSKPREEVLDVLLQQANSTTLRLHATYWAPGFLPKQAGAAIGAATHIPHWTPLADAEATPPRPAAEKITFPRVFSGDQLKMLAFPLGGVAAGSLALGGRGQLRTTGEIAIGRTRVSLLQAYCLARDLDPGRRCKASDTRAGSADSAAL